MIRYLLLLLVLFGFFNFALGQHGRRGPSHKIPVEQGRIMYEYEGNTEGIREFFFRHYGEEQVMYTNLSRSATFFSVTTTTPENVVEFFRDNKHYYFDLESKTSQLIDIPFSLLYKYFRVTGSNAYYGELKEIGARVEGSEEVNGYPCAKWSYRGREFWIWKGLLLKMKSTGLNKNFSMQAIEIDFESPLPGQKFEFPENIAVEGVPDPIKTE